MLIAEKARVEKLKKKVVKAMNEKSEEKPFKQLNINDIVTLSDTRIKQVIKNLEIETVTAALKGAKKEVREKVEKNLGKRALKTYKDMLAQLKNIHESEIKKSKALLIKQIRLLTK